MKKIIVAPLNWGLGHATRCVPIIKSLIVNNYVPVIASDGAALDFLQKEFPRLETLELPSYNISYAKNLKWHLFLQIPKIQQAVTLERKVIEKYIDKDKKVIGIISDNRFGVRSSKVPSVYITHQVKVLSGWATFLTSYVHQRIIKRFDACWIPDEVESVFSGDLSRPIKKLNTVYIGILSRFLKEEKERRYDLAIILSGVEPHRSNLEKKLCSELKDYKEKIVFVRGVIEAEQTKVVENNKTTYNYVTSEELQDIITTSDMIISRAGYSSIMEYVPQEKKLILIPTPKQTEQEYLGQYLAREGKVVCINENDFSINLLKSVKKTQALKVDENRLNEVLGRFFKGERKL